MHTMPPWSPVGERAPSTALPSMARQAESPACLQRQRAETPKLMMWFLCACFIPSLCIFLLCITLTLPGCFRADFGTCCKKGLVLGMVGTSGC